MMQVINIILICILAFLITYWLVRKGRKDAAIKEEVQQLEARRQELLEKVKNTTEKLDQASREFLNQKAEVDKLTGAIDSLKDQLTQEQEHYETTCQKNKELLEKEKQISSEEFDQLFEKLSKEYQTQVVDYDEKI